MPPNITKLFRKLTSHIAALLSIIQLQTLIKAKYRNHYIILAPTSFGDAIHLYIQIKAFKEKNNGKVLILVKDRVKFDLANLFEDIDDIHIIRSSRLITKMERNRKLLFAKFRKIQKLDKIEKGRIVSFTAYQNANPHFHHSMLDGNMKVLGLGPKLEFGKIKNGVIDYEGVFEKYCKHDKGKTVLISPFSHSLFTCHLDNEFWKKLADRFMDDGYRVIFNSNTPDFKSYDQIFLPLSQIIALTEKCCLVIGWRSGFMDVIGYTAINPLVCVVYPDNKALHKHVFNNLFPGFSYDKNKSFAENFFSYDLRKMPKYQQLEKALKSDKLCDQYLDNELWEASSSLCSYNKNKSYAENFLTYFSLVKMFKKPNIKEIIFDTEERTIDVITNLHKL